MAPATRIVWVLLATSVLGCESPRAGRDVTTPSVSAATEVEPMLPSVPDIDNTPRPDDVFSVHSKIGRRNDSLDHRKMDAADRVLEDVKPRLRKASPEQLIAGL